MSSVSIAEATRRAGLVSLVFCINLARTLKVGKSWESGDKQKQVFFYCRVSSGRRAMPVSQY